MLFSAVSSRLSVVVGVVKDQRSCQNVKKRKYSTNNVGAAAGRVRITDDI